MKKKQYKLELSNEAEADFESSYNYYASVSETVADNFFKQTNESFEQILKNPEIYPKIYKNIRRYVLKKFPFVVYFQIENEIIKVIALFHTSRNPEIWMQRTD